MGSRFLFATFDCTDPRRVAEFWGEVLDYQVYAPNEAGGEVELHDPSGAGPSLGFMKVPEGKIVKNRVHLDLTPDQPLEDEVARLEGLGATFVYTMEDPEGFENPMRWTVLRDVEGNEFCVIEYFRDRR
jgi:Glyoxalase-like domain